MSSSFLPPKEIGNDIPVFFCKGTPIFNENICQTPLKRNKKEVPHHVALSLQPAIGEIITKGNEGVHDLRSHQRTNETFRCVALQSTHCMPKCANLHISHPTYFKVGSDVPGDWPGKGRDWTDACGYKRSLPFTKCRILELSDPSHPIGWVDL